MTDAEWTHLLEVIERYRAARIELRQYTDGRQARLDQQAEIIHRQDALIADQSNLIQWQQGRIRELEGMLRGQILNAALQ